MVYQCGGRLCYGDLCARYYCQEYLVGSTGGVHLGIGQYLCSSDFDAAIITTDYSHAGTILTGYQCVDVAVGIRTASRI